MAQPNLDPVELHYLNLWFANVVDILNYDLGQIEDAVPALDKILTNIDTAPIQYLQDSLNEMVENINAGFKDLNDRLNALEGRLKELGR